MNTGDCASFQLFGGPFIVWDNTVVRLDETKPLNGGICIIAGGQFSKTAALTFNLSTAPTGGTFYYFNYWPHNYWG